MSGRKGRTGTALLITGAMVGVTLLFLSILAPGRGAEIERGRSGFAPLSPGTTITVTLTPVAYLPSVYKNPVTATPTATPIPVATPTATRPTQPPEDAAWPEQVGYIRSLAGLPGVTENSAYTDGCYNHARYMVKTDDVNHEEAPGPWYSDAGNQAALNSVLFVYGDTTIATRTVFNSWMTGAFHGVSLIDPRWQTTGYGSFAEDIGVWKFGACMDVNRGLGDVPVGVTYPVFWPGNGTTIPVLRFVGPESPDPLSSCPGYTSPTGPPIYLLMGDGTTVPTVTASSFQGDSGALDHCIFDESTYANPNATFQQIGRDVLGARDAVILLPKAPLAAGKTYTVSITVNGVARTWSFNTPAVSAKGSQPAPDDLFLP